ncbi:hypothetical protein ACQ86O_09405 [Serratia sp. L9]|uniref:hypothetical protein n=1 Tax=Serratia sp. L9 TaxID=3423946 RepID=UPI003D67BAB7
MVVTGKCLCVMVRPAVSFAIKIKKTAFAVTGLLAFLVSNVMPKGVETLIVIGVASFFGRQCDIE